MRYVFRDYELDTACYELRRASTLLPLGRKAFEVLAYLLQHRDRAVEYRKFKRPFPHSTKLDEARVYSHNAPAKRGA